MNMENSVKRTKTSSLAILLLSLAVPIALVGGYLIREAKSTENEANARSGETIKKMFLSPPIVGGNRMVEGFTDTDGDLVADPPADASKQLDPDRLVFSYIADEEDVEEQTAWKALADHLSKAVGKPVEVTSFTDTTEQLRALRDGKLHLTGLNSGSVPVAVNTTGFVPVCLVPGVAGDGVTHTVIIARADSSIQNLADLKGKTMTYLSPASNSGFKAPILALMEKENLQPGESYHIIYSHGHEQSIKGIASKQYEVAAVASDMLERGLAAGDIKKADYRVIYQSESFPTGCIGYTHKLKPELAAKLKAALLSFDWKGTGLEKELTAAKTQFVPANYKDQFSLLRKIDDMTGTKHEIK